MTLRSFTVVLDGAVEVALSVLEYLAVSFEDRDGVADEPELLASRRYFVVECEG